MFVLTYRNFRLMFFGRIVSNIGDSLYAVAAILLIYQLGGSTFYTGLAGFLSILPRLVEFCSGPIIDKIPIKSLLVKTQLIQSVLLLIIPIAAYFDVLSITLVLILTPVISMFNVLIYPAQLASLPKVLPTEKLSKGNAYFTIAYQGIDITFNGLAGILFVLIGPFALYIINSFAFLIGAFIFSFIRFEKDSEEATTKSTMNKPSIFKVIKGYVADLREGVSIMFDSFLTPLIYGAILLNFVSAATLAVFPEYAEVIGGAEYVGFLLMSTALGSLIGALIAPYLKLEKYPLGKLFIYGYLCSGALWFSAVMMPYAWQTLLLYMLAWIPAGALNIVIFTTLQKTTPNYMLGRIFTTATSLSGIAAPIGHLAGGSIGVWIGSSLVIAACGAIVFLIAFSWLMNPKVRDIPATAELKENSLLTYKDITI